MPKLNYENVEGFKRSNCEVIYVQDQSHLDEIVLSANTKAQKIYPFSQGKNWGYGSHLPLEDNSLVLDLSNLNNIIKIDEDQGVAFIEPGVTQAQLASELKLRGSQFYLNVTGSGADTSIIGNSLDRGIAYKGLRAEELIDFEVLLMDGARFKTGFGNFKYKDLYGLYPYGLGPNLQGLFFQSNLGIVTQACIRLNRIQEFNRGVTLLIHENELSSLITRCKALLEQGILEGIPHIGNRERVYSTLIPLVESRMGRPLTKKERFQIKDEMLSDWMVTFFVSGKKSVVKSRVREIKKCFSSLGKLHVSDYQASELRNKGATFLRKKLIGSFKNEVIEASKALSQFQMGIPSDAGIQFLLQQGEVNKSLTGFLLCTPLAPLRGASAIELVKIINQVWESYPGVQVAVTLNVISDRVLEAVITLHFNKENQTTEAHEFLGKLVDSFWEKGFYPYRLNIDQMDRVGDLKDNHSQMISKLKKLFDPSQILAPNRYSRNKS